jgi:hypothetical protein
MARRVPAPGAAPAPRPTGPAAKAAGADDLAVMFPDATLVIDGRPLTVREYRFDESCDVLGPAGPVIAALADIAEGEPLAWGRVRRVLYAHRAVVLPMAAQAGDVDAEWLAALSQRDGERYMQAWWAANGHFFVIEAAVVIVERQQARREFAGPTSSSRSPLPASAHPTASVGSRSVN